MITQKELAETFVRERKRRKMTLRGVEQVIGVNFTRLSCFERGLNKLDMNNFIAVAKWLGIKLDAETVVVYPENTLDAILAVIRADDNLRDKDGLCDLFAACYRGIVSATASR